MYLDVTESPERQLFLTVVTNLVDFRLFSVRIVQLSESRAPQGCLQFLSEPSGVLESFNYNMASASISLKYPQYLVRRGGRNSGRFVTFHLFLPSLEQLKLRDLHQTEHGILHIDLQ